MTEKRLSDKAIGIVLKETKTTNDRKGLITGININPLNNSFTIEYKMLRLDDSGVPFSDVQFITKKIKLRDKGEIGTVEYNEEGFEVEGTFTKIEDENLYVTNWYNSVGKTIMENAIKHVEFVEAL